MVTLIATQKHTDGWVAHLFANKARWEFGNTETEAIGKLVKSCPEVFGEIEPEEQQEQNEEQCTQRLAEMTPESAVAGLHYAARLLKDHDLPFASHYLNDVADWLGIQTAREISR